MQISKGKADAVVDDFEYLADNLPSAAKKLDKLLSDYKDVNGNMEQAKVLSGLCDVAEEIQKYANDALKSYSSIADGVDEAFGIE